MVLLLTIILHKNLQKTGNAIRALGRLATLSASRKSSGANALSSSPRPSISGAVYNNLSNHVNDARMTSVNEEEDVSKHSPSPDADKHLLGDKLKDPRSCNEAQRSDSGFSECSNCSTPSASCVCNLTLLNKNQSILEEQSGNSSSSNEPVDTESAEIEKTVAGESSVGSSEQDIRSEISSLEDDEKNKSSCDDNQNIVMTIRVPTRRELSQDTHGALMSEIERTKVSLEKTAKKSSSFKNLEKLKKNNKVALLMEKFETSSFPSQKIKSAVTNGDTSYEGLSSNTTSVTAFDSVKSFDVSKMCENDVNQYFPNDSYFAVEPVSPTRNSKNPTTFRLSNRVREVTERLSRPKQQTSIVPNHLKQNSGAFVRSNEFWKR